MALDTIASEQSTERFSEEGPGTQTAYPAGSISRRTAAATCLIPLSSLRGKLFDVVKAGHIKSLPAEKPSRATLLGLDI